MNTLLRERRSFAVETTLSGRFHMEMARRARATGWKIGVVYVGLRSPKLAVERVRLRHLSGGHNVPSADVHRRYSRSLKNLVEVYPTADRVVVLDNSSARQPMKRVLEAHKGRIVFRMRSLPGWLRGSFDPIPKEQRR
jgi:predicted ABC-type ATPase